MFNYDAQEGALVLHDARLEEHEQGGRAVAVAAVFVPTGDSMGSARSREEEAVFWAEDANASERHGMGALLDWMDEARVVVAHDAERLLAGLRAEYGGDEERHAAHRAKMVDIGWHVAVHTGRRPRLSTLLRENGQARNAGTGCDADALWEAGRTDAIQDACTRDVRALAEVALARGLRSAGMDVPAAARARDAVLRGMDSSVVGVCDRTGLPALDLVLLGSGADGHCASLYPKSAQVECSPGCDRTYLEAEGKGGVTLSIDAISSARNVLLSAGKKTQADMVRKCLGWSGAAQNTKWPAGMISASEATDVEWLLTEASAVELPAL